jgi:seryl-tRNA synthetase
LLDIKFVRENPDLVRQAMELKGEAADLEGLLARDGLRRDLLKEVEDLKQTRNRVSKEIGKAGADSSASQQKKEEMREVSNQIKELDDQLRQIDAEMDLLLLSLPNIPDAVVPHGKDESDNVEVRSWGTNRNFLIPRLLTGILALILILLILPVPEK